MDWVKNNKKKNLLNMIELLEKRGYTVAELSEKLRLTKPTTRSYITTLKKLKVNVVVIKAKPSIIAIIDKKNIEKVNGQNNAKPLLYEYNHKEMAARTNITNTHTTRNIFLLSRSPLVM